MLPQPNQQRYILRALSPHIQLYQLEQQLALALWICPHAAHRNLGRKTQWEKPGLRRSEQTERCLAVPQNLAGH